MNEGIKACCAHEGRYSEPFRFEMSGAQWVGATNGWAMAAVETGDAEALAAATGFSPGDKGIAGALAITDEGWQPVSLPALRAWCNAEPHTEPCEHCKGTRRLTCEECKGSGRQEHDCDCHYCHVDDDGPCDECGGDGSYDCEECKDGTQEMALPGAICGIAVNRVLLAKALVSAPAEPTAMMRVNGEHRDMLQLSGPKWRAAVMAWREDVAGMSVFRDDALARSGQ